MKAVLVIDVPDNILLDFSKANIEIKDSAYLVNKDESKWKYTKPIKIEDVPLRPLPQKRNECYYFGELAKNEFAVGFNACLEKITGETE